MADVHVRTAYPDGGPVWTYLRCLLPYYCFLPGCYMHAHFPNPDISPDIPP